MRLVSILLGVFLVCVAPLSAQVRASGTIDGRVVDSDGVSLPGVRVLVKGPALIGEQVVYTGADGSYRVPLLPPGTYTLTFRIQAFARVVREEVLVGVRRTTTIDVTMRPTPVEETITVTGRSPLLDVRSTKGSSEYSDELRNALPETRGVGSDLMALVPEASIPVGGQSSSPPSFFGSPPNSTSFQVDGVTVTDPGDGFQFPFYSPDWFEVVDVTTTGASAEFGKAMGGVFNVVTKSGGNSFHGEWNLFLQNDSFIDDNTGGITSAVVTLEPPVLDHRIDFTANVGGPLVEDEAWFFAGYQLFDERIRPTGFASPLDRNFDRFLGKVTWQLDGDNRLIGSVAAETFTLDGRIGPGDAPTATSFEPSLSLTPNITWNSILSEEAFLEIKYSGFYGFFDLIPDTPGASFYEVTTGNYFGAFWGHYAFDRARTNVQGSVSYFAEEFAGDHSFKFGAEWERNLTDDQSILGLGPHGNHAGYLAYLGEPYFAYLWDPANKRDTSLINVTTLYGQDDWTLGDRITLNLGLRYDRWDIGWDGAERDDAPTFDDLSPRLGVSVDLFGDGRTAAHAFYGRFYEEPHGVTFDDFDPRRPDLVGALLDPDGSLTELFRVNALDSLAIDPELRNVFSDQITVGVDHQLSEDLTLGVKYVHKRDGDILGGEDVGSTFVPVQVTASNGTVLDLVAGAPFDPFRVLVNEPVLDEVFREYDGVQIKATKRLSDGWSLIGSLMIQKAEGNIPNTVRGNLGTTRLFDNPNDFVGTPGELPNSRRYVFKLQGSWLVPNPLRTLVGFQFDAASSARWTIEETFSGALGVPFLDRTVPIEEIGSRTIDDFYNLNARFEKKFELGQRGGDIGIVLDVFNLTNESSVTRIFTRVPLFGEPERLQRPREYRIGVRWFF